MQEDISCFLAVAFDGAEARDYWSAKDGQFL